MANKVQEIIEQQVLTVAKAVEDKIDDEIAALENLDLDDIELLRQRRLQQMKKMAEKRTRWVSLGHGEYTEIFSEKDFFTIVKASDRVVCHFYRENWPCKVVDKHLGILAKQHIETRFIKIQAEKSPFLAEKLKIVVLPTIALIKNAKVDDYVVGFNELGGTDDFSTEELEERLSRAQVIYFEGLSIGQYGVFHKDLWACVYYIWQERNLRIFQGKRTLEDVFNLIKDVVRLRIMSLNVYASFQLQEAADIWEFFVRKSNGMKKAKFIDGRSKRFGSTGEWMETFIQTVSVLQVHFFAVSMFILELIAYVSLGLIVAAIWMLLAVRYGSQYPIPMKSQETFQV
ncbi:thioredoxin domain-containing protein [Artemisia annua]|uniref:Thioredoxin domain-containing protein n=1 Tax=Artemisia annua TaxID=35608 RepID=A0A2U1QAR0_ARTAN|nr:thioredoxin domain-containing protein [Artemisia annua]